MRSFSPAPRSTTASPSTRGQSKRSGAGMEGGARSGHRPLGLGDVVCGRHRGDS